MSMNGNSNHSVNEVWAPFVKMWSDYAANGNDQAKQWFESLSGNVDPRMARRRWLDAMAESMEAYMRTPAFLEAMKRNMEGVLHAKDQADNVTKEIARNVGLPTTSDISGLFQRMHRLEERILHKLEAIEERLEQDRKETPATTGQDI